MSLRTAFLYCALALAVFALLSYTAAASKSATYDEPVHVAAAYTHLRYGDFSVEPDHPPLWKYWAALPLLVAGPPVDTHRDSPLFRAIPAHIGYEWPWCVTTLYRTPGNDPNRMIGAARFMMLLLGVALGAMIAVFAYRVAGPVAACVAVTLFALDPNFLAHASLVKNDVPLALATTALAYALWRAGRALTWPRLLAVALLCAACVMIKFTGLLAAPIVTLALLCRALLPAPWPVLGCAGATRGRRLLAACLTCVACAAFAYAAIWAVYLFRFNASPDPGLHYDTARFLRDAAAREFSARHIAPTPEALAAWQPGHLLRAALFALDHRLFPESFLNGLIYADTASRIRYAYLLGDLYPGGRWYYFPVAFVVKAPLATLAALLLAGLLAFRLRGTGRSHDDPALQRRLWLWTCLALPVLIFGLTAVASNLNIGVRHILPVYPPLFIAAGIAAARAYARWPAACRPALAALAVGLGVETLAAFPNYIPFFNAAAGGYRGGYHILSDSNLDWGQDLPLLADWQRRHPERTLHLCYFGSADPAYYGIRYLNMPYGYGLGPERPDTLPTTGVVAISVSKLQNMLVPDPPHNHTYDAFRRRPPTAILGGSIYLFDLDGDQAPPATAVQPG